MNFDNPNDVVGALNGVFNHLRLSGKSNISRKRLLERCDVWGRASESDVARARRSVHGLRILRSSEGLWLGAIVIAALVTFYMSRAGALPDNGFVSILLQTLAILGLVCMLSISTDVQRTLEPIDPLLASKVKHSLEQSSAARDYRDQVVRQTGRELLRVDANIIMALAHQQRETEMLESLKTVDGSGAEARGNAHA
jgi:hypothetical protein